MSRRSFVEKWVYNGVSGSVDREIDLVRSEYPLTVKEGGVFVSTSVVNVMNVPEGKVFSLKTVVATDVEGKGGTIYLLQGSADVIFPLVLNASETKVITNITGVRLTGSVNASGDTSGLYLRIGGFLFDEE